MRKRQWVLYCSTRNSHGDYYISRDYTTPFYSLRNLEHFVDIFTTPDAALREANRRLDWRAEQIAEQRRYLRRRVRELKR